MFTQILAAITRARGSLVIGATVICALLLSSPGSAQDPVDRFEVLVKFRDGRLIAVPNSAQLILSDRYRSRLKPGTNLDALKREFIEAVNRQFELMPKPYFYTLGNTAGHDEVSLDKAGALHDPD